MTLGSTWFCLVAAMLIAYVILDGFDIGVGVLHVLIARTEQERQRALGAIGPVWDGNEVWLIAAAGTLYFAFPLLYASAFSGFYLALMIVLWLLIMRGVAIELRHEINDTVWHAFFDGVFFFSSSLLAMFYGIALANVIRGVPLGADGYFFLPLWTNWRVAADPGILDWYTVTSGLLSVVALTVHGALYLTLKTDGVLEERARATARRLWLPLVGLTTFSLVGSIVARPDAIANYRSSPVFFTVPFAALMALSGILYFVRRRDDKTAFASSCAYLACMVAGAAVALYPRLLPSSGDSAWDITVERAAAGPYTLRVGLLWWTVGIFLALAYVTVIYGLFGDRVRANHERV